MKKLSYAVLAALGLAAALVLGMWLRGDVGMTENQMRRDAAAQILAQEQRGGTSEFGKKMAVFMSWDKNTHKDTELCVYVKHSGLSAGWFFRFGGGVSAADDAIVELRVDGCRERAYVSGNAMHAVRCTIGNGGERSFGAYDPIILVLPVNGGAVIFYDADGNELPVQSMTL